MPFLIQPKVLKGFRDFLPQKEIPRRQLIRRLEDHFSSYGYLPIDTPALEYAEVLLSKSSGETEKQCYCFTDHGNREVALRFDLTVPFARYIAAHRNQITLPFKRYHIGKAWRGENAQKGRYREFIQCDFDLVGIDSIAADLEIMLMAASGLETLGAGEVSIQFNHRGLLNILLKKLGLEEKSTALLRLIDKTKKIGTDQVAPLLEELLGAAHSKTIQEFISLKSDNQATLDNIISLLGAGNHPPVERIKKILDVVEKLENPSRFILNPSIARGLDYYTGIVFETFLKNLPSLGSICSGGRYDNLTELFMKEKISAVGASIGLDRLMAGLEELELLASPASQTDILILMLDENLIVYYQEIAAKIRQANLATEIYLEPKKLSAQFKYAEAKEIPLAFIIGPQEIEAGKVILKDLRSRENIEGLHFEDALLEAQKRLKT